MKLLLENDKEFPVSSGHRPKMNILHRGRTWDTTTIIINGKEIDVYYDSTWGKYGYFEWEGKWYKILVWDLIDEIKYKGKVTFIKRGKL